MIRRITSKEDEEKKRKRNQVIVGVVLALIMILSTLGYSFGTNLGQRKITLNYNNYEFNYLDGFWNVNIGENIFGFINSPLNAYNVSSDVKPLADYYGKPLYLYSENSNAEEEIYRNLDLITKNVTYACPENDEKCGKSFPVKKCSDNFIIIREENISGVYQNNGCVFISGPFENLTQITDGFLLKMIGVQQSF